MTCPECQARLNACAATEEGTVPRVGDLTICAECGHILVFATIDPWTFRLATPEEAMAFCSMPGGWVAQKIQQEYQAMKKRRPIGSSDMN